MPGIKFVFPAFQLMLDVMIWNRIELLQYSYQTRTSLAILNGI